MYSLAVLVQRRSGEMGGGVAEWESNDSGGKGHGRWAGERAVEEWGSSWSFLSGRCQAGQGER